VQHPRRLDIGMVDQDLRECCHATRNGLAFERFTADAGRSGRAELCAGRYMGEAVGNGWPMTEELSGEERRLLIAHHDK
jgi:hypothetical protein